MDNVDKTVTMVSAEFSKMQRKQKSNLFSFIISVKSKSIIVADSSFEPKKPSATIIDFDLTEIMKECKLVFVFSLHFTKLSTHHSDSLVHIGHIPTFPIRLF